MSTPYDKPPSFDRTPVVLIADDHPLFAQALRHALHDWSFDVLETARNGAEAVELATRYRPDVILMDVHMPVLDGIEAARRIAMCAPDSRVIAITSDDAPAITAAMRHAGAWSVLLKTCAPDDLLDAVSGAAAEVVPLRFAGAA